MKTTLNISGVVMQQLKTKAAQQYRTMPDLTKSALRLLFQSRKTEKPLPYYLNFIVVEQELTWLTATPFIT